jgi:hypothetical protein
MSGLDSSSTIKPYVDPYSIVTPKKAAPMPLPPPAQPFVPQNPQYYFKIQTPGDGYEGPDAGYDPASGLQPILPPDNAER